MMHRLSTVVAVVLGTAALAPAQPSGSYSKAVPPEKAVLDRLNLKTEWTQVIPVDGNRDALLQVQTIDDQVFVQTRGGLLVVLDALTGRIQWAARLGTGSSGNAYPVAANAQFVFVAHVTKLYAFYRYNGTTEFVAELGTPPTAGLSCDDRAVFCVLGVRPGSAGAHRVAVYNVLRPIVVNDPVKGPVDPLGQGAKANASVPVDELLKRYNPGAINPPPPEAFDPPARPRILDAPVGGFTGSRTPSVSTLPSVVPPYSLGNRAPAVSMGSLPSFQQPYHLRLESGKYIQQTPSISISLASVANLQLLSDLRPKAVEPPLRWEYGLTARILYALNVTPTRVWAITEGNVVVALNKKSTAGQVVTEVNDRLTAAIPARPSHAENMHYVPLGNGTLLAVDATSGTLTGGVNVKWRCDTGGINNHSPFVTKDYVYAAGDDSGVACVKRDNGELIWRGENNADQVIGANEEFLFVRDRQGRFLVFDAKRATDPARKKSVPLGSADLSEFNVHVVNTANDRVYLAADNGLLVCVRGAAPKYAKPMRIWPAAVVNEPQAVTVDAQRGKGGMEPKEPAKGP